MRRNEHTARLKFLIDLITLMLVTVAAVGCIMAATYQAIDTARMFCALGIVAIVVHFGSGRVL